MSPTVLELLLIASRTFYIYYWLDKVCAPYAAWYLCEFCTKTLFFAELSLYLSLCTYTSRKDYVVDFAVAHVVDLDFNADMTGVCRIKYMSESAVFGALWVAIAVKMSKIDSGTLYYSVPYSYELNIIPRRCDVAVERCYGFGLVHQFTDYYSSFLFLLLRSWT